MTSSKEYREILSRLERIETAVTRTAKTEATIEHKEQVIAQEEQKIERVLVKVGDFTFKRRHLLEGIRGTAGAFLGVGLGRGLLNMEEIAQALPWWKIIGLLIFILALSTLLLYKNMRKEVESKGWRVVWVRLVSLYTIAIVVELFALWLFGGMPSSIETLVKILVIGSYAAMAGAVSLLVI